MAVRTIRTAVGIGTSRRRLLCVSIVAGSAAVAKGHQRLRLHPALTTACLFLASPAIAAGFGRSAKRDAAVWTAQMLAFKNAFELPHDEPDRLKRRAHVDYSIALDGLIGRGRPPGQRLQRRLRRRGHLNALDKALTFFYWTWEIEPHAVIGWIRWRHPERFAGATGRLAAVFDSSLIAYWSIPTAPPWWASERRGRMNGDVHRVMDEVARWVKGKSNPTGGDHETGPNPFASMPSDHFASTAMTAILLTEIDPALGGLGWTYAVLMGFALVYLGEHYVSDLLAGLLLAVTVNAAGAPLERALEGILRLGPES
jgi:membrane-associated phospholipid phosphatase